MDGEYNEDSIVQEVLDMIVSYQIYVRLCLVIEDFSLMNVVDMEVM